jgi:NTE family protein
LKRRQVTAAICAIGAFGLAGCTLAPDADHTDVDAPTSLPLAHKPRVAWVFSSGGPRGFVHVGVLKALAEMGHKPDLLVGASVGALISVVYASGRSALEVEQMSLELQLTGLGRLALGGSERFSGAAIADLVRREVNGAMLEQLRMPVVCVAARRKDSLVVGFNAVRIRGDQYVDPDHYLPLPVRLARALGAERVLAVDASAHEDKAPPAAARYQTGDLRKRALIEPEARAANFTLHPEFGYWVNLSRDFRERAIEAGYKTTLQSAAKITALHA